MIVRCMYNMLNQSRPERPMDLSHHRSSIARALRELERCLERLVDALAHQPVTLSVEGAANDRVALQRVCQAYSCIDYGMADQAGSAIECLGVAGVNSAVLKRAEAVNAAKSTLQGLCAPLKRVRTRVAMKGGDGTKAIPVTRAILRSIQRSDLNLIAAYRKIPILDAPPVSVTYVRALTRSVYRKSLDEIYDLLATLEGSNASSDRARLETLGRNEKFLALARQHYENVRANVVYTHLDPRGRGRVQVGASLPLIYALGRRHTAPEVNFPDPNAKDSATPRRVRPSALESEPFLRSISVYRYLRRPGRH